MPSPANIGASSGSEVLAALVRLVADRAAQPSTHRKKVCFLLGAGADFSSGGLSFAELKRQSIVEFTRRPLFDVTLPEQIEAQFEQLFLSLAPDERALLIEALFQRMHTLAPSDAYKVIVLLAEAGGIDAIVTTNFDTMLERAQQQLGRDLFQVFAPGLARPYLISETRFDLPKKPYLKLHGDIAARSVTLLTSTELKQPQYDASMLELLRSVLRSHDLVLTGYSGYDRALAEVIADSLRGTDNRVFWCNPRPPAKDSPLYSLIADRTRFVAASFDELVMAVARPTLERPSLAHTEPTYLRCLFEWRIEYCNREYFQSYAQRNGRPLADVFARRRLIEDRLAAFLRPNHPLAIITGPSGFGKSTIGVRLARIWTATGSTRIMLVRSRTLPESGDIEQHVVEQLGGLGSRGPFSLFKLERWLRENDLRLVVFVDGLNEFSTDLQRCVQLLRQILRFCYFLPEHDSALRMIATVRQETWNLMLPHLDTAQLRRALWVESESPHALTTIACGPFNDDELSDALTRLRTHGYATINTARLTQSGLNQLRDPYLLGTIADGAQQGLGSVPTARIYQQAFEAKLQRRSSHLDGATLKDILANLAIKTLDHPQDRFREVDVQPAELRGEIVRLMKDLHIFADAGDGFLQFAHDRTLEYFAAVGFAARCGPSLETLDDLSHFLGNYRTHGKALAAARLYFQLAPAERFPLIEAALRLMDGVTRSDRERLFGFAREVLVEMAEQGEPFVEQFLADAVAAAGAGRIGEHQLRTIVQASATLALERAVPLLTRVSHVSSALARTEANIYATDKLVKHFLFANCRATTDLLHDEPFAFFFADPALAPWQRLGRLLGFAAQLGPDNTHPEEYAGVVAALTAALARLRHDEKWTYEDERAFTAHFIANCDRLLFNATPASIERFFGNPQRPLLAAILERLAVGQVLGESDLAMMEGYTQSLSSSIEYHLGHLFFALSSLNDLNATIGLAEARLRKFNAQTAPEGIDFFHAVLVYLHILHNLPYDPGRFGEYEERILREWPAVLLYRPGLERGERRGFQDIFDRIFEDGFDVIYPYGILLPSNCRRRVRYAERAEQAETDQSPLPLYTKYLEEFLRDGRFEEAVQVLHSLAGVIVVWPLEGLRTLRGVIGHQEPRIRRATIRILAEAFNRHPDETIQFLKTSGVAISEDELVEIKIRQDARIGRRQVNEEEWARLAHFLLGQSDGREILVACLRVLLRADSFQDAADGVLSSLGLTNSAAR